MEMTQYELASILIEIAKLLVNIISIKYPI